jgi:hypothetical protein
MSIESLAGMFSLKSGVEQSMSISIIRVIVGFLAQKMIGQDIGIGDMDMKQGMGQGIASKLSGFFGGRGRGRDSGSGSDDSGSSAAGNIGSVLSGLGALNPDHELVKSVQQKTGIQNAEQARQYTQQGIDILKEQFTSNPQGLQSLFSGYLAGGG